jgi:hypothetical protein
LPHAPQWVTEARVSVSQPLVALVSQSPKPALHAPRAQLPARHAAAALAKAHARPHDPQFAGSLVVAASQPLVALPSHSAKPATQVTAHAPREHAGTPLGRGGQALSQRPQWATALRVSVSQPLVALPSQFEKFVAQVATAHAPAVHAAVALARLHPRPQAPQWVVLLRVSTSQPLPGSPSQSAKPASQA